MILLYSSVFYSIIMDNSNLTREILEYNYIFYISFLIYYYNFREKKFKKIGKFGHENYIKYLNNDDNSVFTKYFKNLINNIAE